MMTACVYPKCLQEWHSNADTLLKEADVGLILHPSHKASGLEKLASEVLLHQYHDASRLDIRIVRFHNVYGPGGAWNNGREKAPAAMLRKALAIKLAGRSNNAMEIWGDGLQRRSFLWIEDCVDAVLCLLRSPCTEPVNIGSERSVSIKELAALALRIAGVTEDHVEFQYDPQKPVGVASRNSNNDFVLQQLGWEPATSLEEGMAITGEWIGAELQKLIQPLESQQLQSTLQALQHSQVVDLESNGIVFAILLPITSRGSQSPNDCLANLASFAHSLARTTWRDTHELGGHRFSVKIYLAIDADDDFLCDPVHGRKARDVLEAEGITEIVTLSCSYPPGHVCSLWRDCARRAWEDGCEYFSLMADDVTLEDEGWMRGAHAEFVAMAADEGAPLGFGCIAFTDVGFPGMPTFPIVHHTHMDIFGGEVVPDIFVNQDGDPYLFQLYRRWGCLRMFSSRIRNSCGGSEPAKYTKQHAVDWTFDTLDDATVGVEKWLSKRDSAVARKLTIDIVVPCYRVQMPFLESLLQLKSSGTCTVMFIIIIDDPQSPHIGEFLQKYAHRPDIRIRINASNLGASAARNRGMRESAAEWVHFLDDDVTPRSDILIEAEKAIRAHPRAAGFVGKALFPQRRTSSRQGYI